MTTGPGATEEELNRRHNEKAARRKEVRARMLATKTEERGLLIVHTGKGKGKSTAAFGLVLRCLGHGMRVGIVQFVKGAWSTGERVALERPREMPERAVGFTGERRIAGEVVVQSRMVRIVRQAGAGDLVRRRRVACLREGKRGARVLLRITQISCRDFRIAAQ